MRLHYMKELLPSSGRRLTGEAWFPADWLGELVCKQQQITQSMNAPMNETDNSLESKKGCMRGFGGKKREGEMK